MTGTRAAGRLMAGLLTMSAGAGAMALAAGQEPAPAPKYRFSDVVAAGDAYSAESVDSMDMDMNASRDGTDAPFKLVTRSREAFRHEVLAYGGGKPAVFRRTYLVHRSSTLTPDGEQKVKVSSLQGKTVTIRVAGKKVTVTTSKGKLLPADVKRLQDRFDGGDDGDDFIPDRELTPGDEWTVSPAALRKAFDGFSEGSVKGRFERVLQHDERALAEVRFEMDFQGKPGGLPGPLKVVGTIAQYFDLDLKRPMGMRVMGDVDTMGEIELRGLKFQVTGAGKAETVQRMRWLKLAGKPVKSTPVEPSQVLSPPPGSPGSITE